MNGLRTATIKFQGNLYVVRDNAADGRVAEVIGRFLRAGTKGEFANFKPQLDQLVHNHGNGFHAYLLAKLTPGEAQAVRDSYNSTHVE